VPIISFELKYHLPLLSTSAKFRGKGQLDTALMTVKPSFSLPPATYFFWNTSSMM
jgi:hypothetical protein